MARTTTKPKSYPEVLADAEKGFLDRQARQHETLRDAGERLARTDAELDDARELADDLLSAFAAADDSETTPEGYAAAQAAVDLLEARHNRCRRDLDRATSSAQSTDTEVAEALLPAVERALPSIPVHTSMLGRQALPVPEVSQFPTLVASQVSPTKLGSDGTIAADELEVNFYRLDGVHERLDGRQIEDATHELGQRVQAMSRSTKGLGAGLYLDTVRVKVHRIHIGLPVVEEVDPFQLGWTYARRLAHSARTPGWSVKLSETNTLTSTHVEVAPSRSASSIVSESVEADGTRTTEIVAVANVHVIENIGLEVGAIVRSVADDLAGLTIDKVGRIESITPDYEWSRSSVDGSNSVRVKLTATVKSQAPGAAA